MVRTTIDIFQYMQYRPYFRAVYDDLKRKDIRFSFRSLQVRAGFSGGSNHFWQILNGAIQLTVSAADRYGAALGLTAKEKAHLRNMIALEQAKNDTERETIIVEMLSSSRFLSEKKYQAAALVMFSDSLLPILFNAVSLDTFKEDPAWIAANYFNDITPAEIAAALQKLLDHGLLYRDEHGILRQTQINMTDYLSASRETSEAIKTMRRTQIRKTMTQALDAMDRQPFNERLFYSSSIPVSKELYEEMKERVIAFQEDLRAIALKGTTKDAVYQLNIQFYSPFK